MEMNIYFPLVAKRKNTAQLNPADEGDVCVLTRAAPFKENTNLRGSLHFPFKYVFLGC